MILKWYGNIGASRNRHYENVPFEIPLNWVWAKGYDIFHPMESTKPQGEFFNYIDIDAIDNVRNVVSCPKHLLCKDAPSRATRRVSKGDVLFSMVRPYLRNIAKVEIDDCIASTGFYVCKTNGTITCDYCYYMMISNYVVDGLNHFMKGDNSPSINNDNILSWLYPIPPLTEQQRIVLEIERWFYLIDNLEDSKSDLKDFVIKTKSKVLDLAIHGKLVEQDPNDEPASELLKRIAPNATLWDNSQYENLPQGWVVCKLEDIVDYEQPTQYLVQSTNYSDNYKTPVLTAGKSFILGYTNETTGIFDKLPTIIFDDFTTDSRFVVFPFKVKSSAMKLLQVNKEINIRFVAYFMSITRLVGDTHKRYWISEYSKIPIPLPPIKEQNRIVQAIQDIEAKLNEITTEL